MASDDQFLKYARESIEEMHFRLQFKRFWFQVWAHGIEAARLGISPSEHCILKMLQPHEVKSYIFEHIHDSEGILDVITRIKSYS